MTLDWRCPQVNGWYPKLSYPWVAYGVRQVRLTHLETGETHDLPFNGYAHGWLDATTLRCSKFYEPGNDNVRHWVDVTVPSMGMVEGAEVISLSEAGVSGGHWASWIGGGPLEVSYDGRVIASNMHGVRQDGEWVAARSIADDYALRIYHVGVMVRRIPIPTDEKGKPLYAVTDWAVLGSGPHAGTVVYGCPQVVNEAGQNVSRSPWFEGNTSGGLGSGFKLLDVDGVVWLWSCGQIGQDGWQGPEQWGVLGGVLGEPEVVTAPIPAVCVDAQRVGDGFIVAGNDDRGWLRVVSVPVTASRARIVKPIPPPPEATFVLDQTEGPVPLTVTARLIHANLTTWRWTLNGEIHHDSLGQADNDSHVFVLTEPRVSLIGLRTSPVVTVLPQVVTTRPAPVVVSPPVVVQPQVPARQRWCLNTFELLPEPWAETIAAKGWGRVRVGGTNYGPLMDQCARNALWPLWVLGPGEHLTVPGGIATEIGNECNAGCAPMPRLSPSEYALWVRLAAPVLLAKSCTVYAGAINNFSKEAMDWLRAALALIPPELRQRLHLSAHRYLDPDQDVSRPKKGFSSLAAEERYWLVTTQGLPWAVTEAGIVDATYRDWSSWRYFGKKRVRLAFDGHRAQAKRLLALGAEFYCVYQMQDGPTTAFIDQCGVRTYGTLASWKATADLPLGG